MPVPTMKPSARIVPTAAPRLVRYWGSMESEHGKFFRAEPDGRGRFILRNLSTGEVLVQVRERSFNDVDMVPSGTDAAITAAFAAQLEGGVITWREFLVLTARVYEHALEDLGV